MLGRAIFAAVAWAAAKALAFVFGNACPLDPGSFVCGHWADICAAVAAVLGALGYGFLPWKKSDVGSSTASLTVVPPPDPEDHGTVTVLDPAAPGDDPEIDKLRNGGG